jgi:hypothetical protein
MPCRRLFAAILLLGALSNSAQAADDRPADSPAGRWFLSIDVLGHTGYGSPLNDDLAGGAAQAVAAGSTTVTGGASVGPVFGPRLGYMVPAARGLLVGASVGVLYGPNYVETLDLTGPGGSLRLENDGTTWWWRGMAEFELRRKLAGRWSVLAAGGAGIAYGRQDETVTCQGACPGAISEAATSGVGFAWEASLGIVYRRLELRLSTDGLPKLPLQSGDVPFPALTTSGLSLRYYF